MFLVGFIKSLSSIRFLVEFMWSLSSIRFLVGFTLHNPH
jgi:hypothetical protein